MWVLPGPMHAVAFTQHYGTYALGGAGRSAEKGRRAAIISSVRILPVGLCADHTGVRVPVE